MGGSQPDAATASRGCGGTPTGGREPPTPHPPDAERRERSRSRRRRRPPADPRSDAAAAVAVEIVHWPRDASTREHLARASVPRLLLVERGAHPPDELGLDEDWTWATADARTVATLATALRRRVDELVEQPVILDDTGVLHRGSRSVALNPSEATIMRVLLARDGVVMRGELERALWPDGTPGSKALGAIIYRLRRQLAGLLLAVEVERGRGYSLLPAAARGP